MKRLKIIFIIGCICALCSCSHKSNIDYVSKDLRINLPDNIEYNLVDTHGGFHGDGELLVTVKFDEESRKNLLEDIKSNKSWKKLPLAPDLELIMYGGERNGITYSYKLAESAGIPTIENGYWLFIDRFNDINIIHDSQNLFDRGSFNFTLALFDTDNNVLYYYEFDT
ncbi:hypothetical protein [Fusibacter ferrireducens]|uniref:Lipoprotein n=1 Tax=Fusibacter ferrireducens TaxID=2785058 RepID=A0ABR9ZZ78_9FIRM|nr:hypothetical protein [Fusibacter ferrireducens]MBF4695759.1 hypothetical protein [Fusibacter ferrireducens]